VTRYMSSIWVFRSLQRDTKEYLQGSRRYLLKLVVSSLDWPVLLVSQWLLVLQLTFKLR